MRATSIHQSTSSSPRRGLHTGEDGVDGALRAVDAVYVAFDCDVLDPDEEVISFMPEPGGLTLVEALAML